MTPPDGPPAGLFTFRGALRPRRSGWLSVELRPNEDGSYSLHAPLVRCPLGHPVALPAATLDGEATAVCLAPLSEDEGARCGAQLLYAIMPGFHGARTFWVADVSPEELERMARDGLDFDRMLRLIDVAFPSELARARRIRPQRGRETGAA